MGVLGPDPDGEPLTAHEVAQLAEDTAVTITWGGGNGPHDYVIVFGEAGERFAYCPQWNDERLRYYNPIVFVGSTPMHTRVWLR